MPHITITETLPELSRKLSRMERQLIPAATAKALNKIKTTARSAAVKEIAGQTGIKQKDVRKDITMTTANKKKLSITLDARGGRAKNLISFVRPAQRNTTAFRKRLKSGAYKQAGVKARAWKKMKTYRGTFIGKGRGGNTLVLKRTGSSRNSKVDTVYGPSVRRDFVKSYARKAMRSTVKNRWKLELNRAINQELRRFYKRL